MLRVSDQAWIAEASQQGKEHVAKSWHGVTQKEKEHVAKSWHGVTQKEKEHVAKRWHGLTPRRREAPSRPIEVMDRP